MFICYTTCYIFFSEISPVERKQQLRFPRTQTNMTSNAREIQQFSDRNLEAWRREQQDFQQLKKTSRGGRKETKKERLQRRRCEAAENNKRNNDAAK